MTGPETADDLARNSFRRSRRFPRQIAYTGPRQIERSNVTGVAHNEGVEMEGNVYKHLELTGTSKKSMEEAAQIAISEAAKTVRNMSWFEVIETRGAIKNGKIAEWQVTVRIGFKIER
jgi:flavin-binding protein dodecin